MKILVSYREIPQSPGWATGDLVVKALRALGHEVFPYAKYYQQNRWVEDRSFGLDDHEFDLILFMECNDGDLQYPELRITRARKTACWLFDTSYHTDRYRGLVDYFGFDHLFLANPLTIQEYKVWGYNNVHYLPYACDRELHSRPLTYPKTRDVVLVGSIREDRVRLKKDLAKQGINLELIGDVFREQYIDTLASAKIVVNQNPEAGRGLLNMRFWEAQAAGAWIITEKSDLDLNDNLNMPSGCYYENMEDLAYQCRYILNECPKPLEFFTGSLQSNIIRDHAYNNRCQKILETVFS